MRISPRTAGSRTEARSTVISRVSPVRPETIVSSTSVPGGPLIRAVETSEETPAIDFAVDLGDHVVLLDPGLLGRRVGKDGGDPQAPRDLGDGQPDALEAARGRGLEVLELVGGEVVGELVLVRAA